MLTDEGGEAVGKFSYSAYGQPAGSTGTQTTPLGYAGQLTDEQSGLLYMRARVYDPVTGQFLTRDPLEWFTRQPYVYVNDNPIASTDPAGLRGGEEEIACPWCLPAPPPPETWKKAGEELAEPFEHLWNSIFGNGPESGPTALEEHQLEIGECRAEEFGSLAEGRKEIGDAKQELINAAHFSAQVLNSTGGGPPGGSRGRAVLALVFILIHAIRNGG